jgi:hypothetical protein
MRSKLTLLALVLMLACLPAAAGEVASAAPAAEPAVAAPAPAPVDGPAEDVTLDEFLDSLSPTAGAENKYICPDWGDCTNARDCQAHQAPRDCGWGNYACSNPAGKVCQGMCFCT